MKFNKKIVIFIIIGLTIIGLLVLFILSNENKKIPDSKVDLNSIQPNKRTISPTESVRNIPPGIPEASRGYFMNTVGNNLTPATGVSWVDKKFFYSTKNGIYLAGSNDVITKTSIEDISWNSNGKAIYKSANKWIFIDLLKKEQKEIQRTLIKPNISPDGNSILDFFGTTIEIVDTSNTLNVVSKDLTADIISAMWSINGNFLAVSLENQTNKNIVIYNKNLEELQNISMDKSKILSSISPDGNRLVIYDKNNLSIINFDSETLDFPLKSNTNIVSVWVDNNTFLEIETFSDDYGRKIDELYKISTQGKKELIIDSKPIIKRLNTNINMVVNDNKKSVIVIDNSGKIWIIALVPNQIPFYTSDGITFNKVKNLGI